MRNMLRMSLTRVGSLLLAVGLVLVVGGMAATQLRAAAPPAAKGSKLIYRHWVQGPCHGVGVAGFVLRRAARVDRLRLAYKWHGGEQAAGFTITRHGQTVFTGRLQRGPGGSSSGWHPAMGAVGVTLGPGEYRVRIKNRRLCGVAGAGSHIEVYGRTTSPPPPRRSTTLFANPKFFCKGVDQADFHLDRGATIKKMTAWIVWPSGVTTVRYRIMRGGKEVHRGTLRKIRCVEMAGSGQPGIEDGMRLRLSRGTYKLVVRGARFCGNVRSRHKGMVRVIGY